MTHKTNAALLALRRFMREPELHGQRWAALKHDGGVLCERCTRANYRDVLLDTKRRARRSAWRIVDLISEADAAYEPADCCSHCDAPLFRSWRGQGEVRRGASSRR